MVPAPLSLATLHQALVTGFKQPFNPIRALNTNDATQCKMMGIKAQHLVSEPDDQTPRIYEAHLRRHICTLICFLALHRKALMPSGASR